MVCHACVKEDRARLFEKTVTEFGGFHILISNAAVNPSGSKRLVKVIAQMFF
jgi:NAD(P)-dependent dehydrogenase (short-subunit alcohol dehydrogenase family)